MLVDDEKKFIFIHNPRTGGGTILQMLGHPELTHLCYPASWVKSNNLDKWDSYYKFAFVRNPYDWILSTYLFHTHTMDVPDKKVGFKAWIASKFPPFNLTPSHASLYLDRWLRDKNGNMLVDNVFKFEDYENSLKTIFSAIGVALPAEIPVVNKIEHDPYREYYDDDTRNRIYEHFRIDLEYFGYSF
jgi:hypothetical protein